MTKLLQSYFKDKRRVSTPWRTIIGLWSLVLAVALTAPWPYAIMAALFAVFLHFAILDERAEVETRD